MKSQAINIYETELGVKTQVWYAPNSSLWVAIVSIIGDVSELRNSEKENRIIERIINIVGNRTRSKFYIIDIKGITNQGDFIHELYAKIYYDEYKPIFLISESQRVTLNQEIFKEENICKALNFIARQEKKRRNDGGKNLRDYNKEEIILGDLHFEKRRHRADVFEIQEGLLNSMLIELEGDLVSGSGDDDDVEYIVQIISDTIKIEYPKPLIVDATKLRYTWGDALRLIPFEAKKDKAYPYRLVLRPEQLEPFAYIIGSETRICSTVEQAIIEIKLQIETKL